MAARNLQECLARAPRDQKQDRWCSQKELDDYLVRCNTLHQTICDDPLTTAWQFDTFDEDHERALACLATIGSLPIAEAFTFLHLSTLRRRQSPYYAFELPGTDERVVDAIHSIQDEPIVFDVLRSRIVFLERQNAQLLLQNCQLQLPVDVFLLVLQYKGDEWRLPGPVGI